MLSSETLPSTPSAISGSELFSPAVAVESPDLDAWRTYHLFYHGDRDLLLDRLVRPLVSRLLEAGSIDRFYFVRYGLGGPHVRLRWRALQAAPAEAALAEACERFFAEHPADSKLDPEELRRVNRALIHNDPLAGDDQDLSFADGSWARFDNGFELERYGGPRLFATALEAFSAGSAEVLGLVSRGRGETEARRRTGCLAALASLAWGLADRPDDVVPYLGYGPSFMGSDFEICRDRGDRFFESRREALTALVRHQLFCKEAGCMYRAGRTVARSLRALPRDRHWYVAVSHLHMTANRLGLTNAEEVYMTQMLRRAGAELRSTDPELFERLWRDRPEAGLPRGEELTRELTRRLDPEV